MKEIMMSGLMDAFGLTGKAAVVTGGATGIGLAVVKCLAEAGAKVIAVGSRTPGEAAPALEKFGSGVAYRQFNLLETERCPAFAESLLAEFGQVDILVNNAGAHCKKPTEEMSTDDFRRVVDVNVTGAFALTRAFIPHMKARKSGSVVFMASMVSYMGLSDVAGYCVAKSGLLGLVRSLTVDLAPYGIRVNAVAPGWIDTPMFRAATANDPKRLERILNRIAVHEPGTPEDIGYAVVYLSSRAARYVNGACLPVDGGALVNL